jgi:flagellar basal-body rod protein FlgG
MIRALNTAATGMQAQQNNMDVIANNMANVSTVGFKKSRAEFEDLLYHTQKEPGARTGLNSIAPNGVQLGLGVKTSAVNKDFAIGSPKITNRSLDVMIEGNGFFPVMKSDGQIAYTRNGSFDRDTNGRIVDQSGNVLQPEIVIPPNTTGIEFGPNGQVSILTGNNTLPETIGQIEIVNFVNPAGLKAIGKNLFMPSSSSGQPVQGQPGQNGFGQLAQNQLEMSNVNIVDEMVNMITAQRAYETNSKVIQGADQMLQAVNQLK